VSLWYDYLLQASNSLTRNLRLKRAIDYFIKDQDLIAIVAVDESFCRMYFDFVSIV
jgi:CMP-N-acetylneuraminic acid synthetase